MLLVHKFVYYFLYSGAGLFLEDGDRTRDGYGLGVDEVAGSGARHIVDETSGGIDVHRGAHDDEIVGFLA